MNARLAKPALTLCSILLLNFAGISHAQDANTGDAPAPSANAGGRALRPPRAAEPNAEDLPAFNIQIENGRLSLATFKEMPGKNPWETNVTSVPATIDNLSKYLRAIDPNLNIVLSPDVGKFIISDLKLNTRNPWAISQAVGVASGGAIVGPNGGPGIGFGGGLRGVDRTLTFVANLPRENKRSVEVFNLSGYIQTLGKADEKVVRQKIDELQELTESTLMELSRGSDDFPDFKYHPGTRLLIVIGRPEAIEVTHKIVNALPGQQTNGKADLLETIPPSGQN